MSVDSESLRRKFADPPAEFSPLPMWWWSGERVDSERALWQLGELRRGGIRQVMVMNLAPRGPLYGADPDDPALFTERWWQLFLAVCEGARDLSMKVWFYDQIGFGGANIQGDLLAADRSLRGQALRRSQVTANASIVELHVDPRATILGAWQDDAQSLPRPATWRPADGIPGMIKVEARVGGGAVTVISVGARGFDFLGGDGCSRLIDAIHGTFERRLGEFLGTTVIGSFQDEMPALPTWSATFAQAFADEHGYDVCERLPALWSGSTAASARLRMDYQATRARLAEEAFFRPLHTWHEKHGLLCGFDNSARTGGLAVSVRHYADYQRTHRWFSVPGCDHVGNGKFNTSIGHMAGAPRTWIEAFHSSGWGGTIAETFDWLVPWLRAGATLYNPHAVYYSTRGGWWEWAPPSTCWRQPYWQHYEQFASTVSRLCAVLSEGVHECDVAVLYPGRTAQGHTTIDGGDDVLAAATAAYEAVAGSMVWMDLRLGALDADSRDFDIIDELAMSAGDVGGGRLRLGAESYSALVLPGCVELAPATVAVVDTFASAGGLVVAVEPVADAVRSLALEGRVAVVPGAEELALALRDLRRSVTAPVPTLRRRVGDCTVVLVPAVAARATTFAAGGYGYEFDEGRYTTSTTITVADVEGVPQLWDFLTGEQRPLPSRRLQGGVEVEVPFDLGPVALVVFDPAVRTTVPETEGTPFAATVTLEGPWTSRLLPTGDNRHGDLALPRSPGPLPPQTWRFLHRVEASDGEGEVGGWKESLLDPGGWSVVEATHGVQAWRRGPLKEPPAPWSRDAAENFLGAEGWSPVVYSLSRGIAHDPAVGPTLGTKGRISEEFVELGPMAVGDTVVLRTEFVLSEEFSGCLVTGCPTRRRAYLDGAEVTLAGEGYHALGAVHLSGGAHRLELHLVCDGTTMVRTLVGGEETRRVRLSWALTDNAGAYERPEWMATPEELPSGHRVFRRYIHLSQPPSSAILQLGTTADAELRVNDIVVGVQEPTYHGWLQPYPVTALRAGANLIEIVLSGSADEAALLDGVVSLQDGAQMTLVSGAPWEVVVGTTTSAVRLRRDQWLDPAWQYLRRRPHPLPRSRWILADPPADDGGVLEVLPRGLPEGERVEWLRWTAPPGTVAIELPPIHGVARLFVDGVETEVAESVRGGRHGGSRTAELNDMASIPAVCALRVETRSPQNGGALLEGPVTYVTAEGTIGVGSWEQFGLESWSGGVEYSCTFEAEKGGAAAMIEITAVRGSVEVELNGRPLGSRSWAPYQFAAHLLHAGVNNLQIRVYNTLAPHLFASSPSPYVLPGQLRSGLLGPVIVRVVGGP